MRSRLFQIPLSPPLLKGEAKNTAAWAALGFIGAFEALTQITTGFDGGNLT